MREKERKRKKRRKVREKNRKREKKKGIEIKKIREGRTEEGPQEMKKMEGGKINEKK